MFLKVKIVMAEFANPSITLMLKAQEGKVCNVSKNVEIAPFQIHLILHLPLSHDQLHSIGGSTRQNQGELSTKRCSSSKQVTRTTWANCKNRPFLKCSCYVLKQNLLWEVLCRTPLLTQTQRKTFNKGIQSAVFKGNLLFFRSWC